MKALLLRAKKAVFDDRTGLFRAGIGEGFDFEELVEYDYQSDARRIDWISYAKSGTLYQKRYRTDQARNIIVAPILTGSLLFGYEQLVLEWLWEITALIGYSALAAKDRLHLLTTLDGEHAIYPIGQMEQLEYYIQKFGAIDPVGLSQKIDPKKLLALPKSLLILVGDFLEDVDLTLPAAKHDLVAIVLAPKLRVYPKGITTTDNITRAIRSTTLTPATIAHYHEKRSRHYAKVFDSWQKTGVDHLIIDSEPIYQRLRLFFGRR